MHSLRISVFQCVAGDPCWNSTRCINTVPGYQCLACPEGYEGTYEDGLAVNDTQRTFEYRNLKRATVNKQTCRDIDECAVAQLNSCVAKAICTNTIVSGG